MGASPERPGNSAGFPSKEKREILMTRLSVDPTVSLYNDGKSCFTATSLDTKPPVKTPRIFQARSGFVNHRIFAHRTRSGLVHAQKQIECTALSTDYVISCFLSRLAFNYSSSTVKHNRVCLRDKKPLSLLRCLNVAV